MPSPITVIIPTLNAAASLPACIDALMPGLEAGLIRELIISDGGSTDATAAIAEGAGARLIAGAKGRGAQLAAGAREARGDWLLFLHADTCLSRDWAERVEAHLSERPGKAATFTLAFRSDAGAAKRVAALANWRARNFGLPYGDQGLLISRALYDAVGGYQDLPLMEDVALVRAIGKAKLAILSAEARTGAERFEREGWNARSLRNTLLVARYLMGAKPDELAKAYRKPA
jgi:rSAM/selenodomain-associated transferase 2